MGKIGAEPGFQPENAKKWLTTQNWITRIFTSFFEQIATIQL